MLPAPNLPKIDLNTSITNCQTYIRTIHGVSYERNKILEWFKLLCEHLTQLISSIATYCRENKEILDTSIQKTLLFYLTQLLTTLSFMINIFVKEEEAGLVITEARNCVTKQIICCLDLIDATFKSGSPLDDPSGNFVKWMDAALEKIPEISDPHNIHTFTATRELFEEVLSHAMSIAQVSLDEDSRTIRGACQSVLNALNSLESEIKGVRINGAMLKLFTDSCSDKLCNLERKVNTAVLKLSLYTFSRFVGPLERIRDFCFDPSNKRKVEELDGLVADFDLHVDRIMQVGLFAVSCSSDLGRGIKIRSCLASLEALESELVPAFTSVLLDPSTHNISCAVLAMGHWIGQALGLRRLIFLIIDPFAFCQVVYEEAADCVDELSCLLKRRKVLERDEIDRFVDIVNVLRGFIEEAQSEFNQSEALKVRAKLKDFSDVLEEVQSASKALLSNENNNFENSTRVLKRCKILLTVLKRLWYCFIDDDVPSNKNESIEKQVEELSSKIDNLPIEPTGNAFLDHIINRGKQILQDRSVLYKTPVKNCQTLSSKSSGLKCLRNDPKELPLSKLVHLRKLSFMNTSVKNEPTLDLQITDILGDLTNLSATFTKVVQ